MERWPPDTRLLALIAWLLANEKQKPVLVEMWPGALAMVGSPKAARAGSRPKNPLAERMNDAHD